MSQKILITGIDGFTGQHLKTYFINKGFQVYGTTYTETNLDNSYKCDITDINSVRIVLDNVNPDFIIHLAAISFVGHTNIEAFYKTNVVGTLNILDALLLNNHNPKKIIIASSATVYGNQNKEILDEALCPKPANHYGASKYSMECLVSNYFDKLNIIITRPFNYTGVGQSDSFLIPKIVNHYKQNKQSIKLGNLDVVREFNDITFVCDVYYKMLNSSITADTFNICSQRGIKLIDVISMMNEIANYDIKVEIENLLIRHNEIKVLIGSNVKLFSSIGKIEQSDFRLTLQEMYEY